MKLDRRRFLIGSAVAAIAASAKGTLPLAESREHNSPQVSGNPLKIPPVISGGTLNVAPANTQVMTGAATRVLAINNTFPAPTIRVRKGDTFNAHIVNNLTDDVVLHWHGQHVPAIMDGHPKYAIAPGASTDITFPVVNRA